MNHQTSIKHLYQKNIQTILHYEPVDKALAILEKSKESALIVLDDDAKPLGILTERDVSQKAGEWSQILQEPVSSLMSSPLKTVSEDMEFREAYVMMNENGFRHLVVVDKKDKLLGIIYEGDFLKHLTSEQLLTVKEVHLVMSKNVITVTPDKTLAETIELMLNYKISSIIVVEDKKPIGIFTERDSIHLARIGDDVLANPIHQYMSSPLKTIHKENSVLEAEEYLNSAHIRRLVVVDDEGKLEGIVTQHDLVKGIPGIYFEMLRDTIKKQSKMLHKTYDRLEEQSVLKNILNSFDNKLIIACNLNNIIEYTNVDIVQYPYNVPHLGGKLDEDTKCFDSSIVKHIFDSRHKTTIYDSVTLLDVKGVENFFKTSYAPIFSKKGALKGFLFTAENITAEKTAYKQLEETKNKLQEREKQLLEAQEIAQFGNWTLDIKTMQAEWSDEIRTFFNIDKNRAASPELLSQMVLPADWPAVHNSLMSAITDGTSHNIEYRVHRQNSDDIIWVNCRGIRIIDSEGVPIKLVGTLQDITAMKVAEQKEKQLMKLIDSSSNEFYVFDKESLLFKYANRGALNNLQYTLAEIKELYVYDIKPKFTKDKFLAIIKPLIDNRLSQIVFETIHTRKDGTTYPVEVHLQLLETLENKQEFLAVILDITERKKAQAQLKEQEELMFIQSKQAAMGEMISMIAHQWRQPLSVVSMDVNNILLDISLEEFSEEKTINGLNNISNQVQYMSQTIEDFRNFFKQSKNLEEDKLINIINDILSIIGTSLKDNNIEVNVSCDSSIEIQTYKSELKQVIINILSNAKDAFIGMEEEKNIDISAIEIDKQIILKISNNGPAIPKNIIHTVFEAYFTTKEHSGGTGLGLYMSNSIIQKHMHGTINIENIEGRVVFTINIPSSLKDFVE